MRQLIIRVLKVSLPQWIKYSLVNLCFNIERDRFQYLASKYLYAPNMKMGLEFLASLGFRPKTVLDIGAFEGDWSKIIQTIWPAADLVLVEPNRVKADALKRDTSLQSAKIIEALLGDEDGKVVNFNLMESGSSVLEEHSSVPRTKIDLVQSTLDTILPAGAEIDLIKLDVQGYELHVLRGGQQILKNARAVILELSLIEINEGAPLLDKVVHNMKQWGFVSFDILEIHRRPLDGVMNQIDIIFVPENSPLRSDRRHST